MEKGMIECISLGFDKSKHNGKRITSKEQLLEIFADVYELAEKVRKQKHNDDISEGALLVYFINLTNKQIKLHGFETDLGIEEQDNV